MTIARRLGTTLALVMLLAVMAGGSAEAAVRDGLRWTAGCDGFTSQGGGIILNRDNTGQGREQFVITATDGDGNVIFGPVTESFFVGSRLYFAEGSFFPYAVEPASNPILVTVVSPAGNGEPEQTVYSTIGNCAGLATNTSGVDFVNPFDLPADGSVSPSTPLNVDPPRPTNPDGIGDLLTGFLIVDTSSANIRSGDGPQYTIVGRVSGGTELIVLGVNERRLWWYVQVGDIRGWINNELVINRGDLSDVPVVPVNGEIALPRLYLYSPQPVRIAPSANAAAICTIGADLEYFVLAQTRDGGWFEIEAFCGGQSVTGWVPQDSGGLRNSGSLPIVVVD